ncbi:MAG: lipase/esterase [Acidimicrobiales bacterium]|nr:lipase/esterase [Acidimicrobiales bacterium]
MTLDPVAAEVIRAIEGILPRAGTVPVEELRRRTLGSVADTVPIEVATVVDISVPGPGGLVGTRLYRPAAGPAVPVVAFFHGGGWVTCDLNTHDAICRSLVRDIGCAVLSVDYRRAPEHRFPAALVDCFAALNWLAGEGAMLGLDPSRIAVAGDSAGGNLAAAVCLMARDRGGPAIVMQVLVYPVTDHRCASRSFEENGDGFFVTAAELRWYWDQYAAPEDRANGYASPLLSPDLAGLPPALVVVAEHDPLRDEGEAYGQRLSDAGGSVTVSRYAGMFHGFYGVGVLDASGQAQAEVATALRAALRVAPTDMAH